MQPLAIVRKLNKGDKVLVYNEHGNLRDSSSELFTQFIGMLLDNTEVVFNANRETDFTGKDTIPYSSVDVNLGNGMTAAGTFTAPVSGIYYFHYQAVSQNNGVDDAYANLKLNGRTISSCYTGPTDSEQKGHETFGMQTLSVLYRLNKGDKVSVDKYKYGSLLKNSKSKKNTQFMGWLLNASHSSVVFDALQGRSQTTTGPITYSSFNSQLRKGINRFLGTFAAPVSGIYYLHFQGLTDTGDSNLINMKLNGKIVASTFRSKQMVKLLWKNLYDNTIVIFYCFLCFRMKMPKECRPFQL